MQEEVLHVHNSEDATTRFNDGFLPRACEWDDLRRGHGHHIASSEIEGAIGVLEPIIVYIPEGLRRIIEAYARQAICLSTLQI